MKSEQVEIEYGTLTQVQEVVNDLRDAVLYESSIHEDDGDIIFLIRENSKRVLFIIPAHKQLTQGGFRGDFIESGSKIIVKCHLNHTNAEILRSRFAFTNAVLIGKETSFGFGDRLGNAGPAHIRALKESYFKPILAQQSIRELERTNRSADEVMDAASWAVFQEGYHSGFGADGDHLKSPADIDRMVSAGFTMFTIDSSDYVVHEAGQLKHAELETTFSELPWRILEDTPDACIERLMHNSVQLSTGYKIEPDRHTIVEAMVKYGRVIAHMKMMWIHLNSNFSGHPAELELSIDETNEPLTFFEHYLIASELHRLGVEIVGLAPRFCGNFEIGIEYKGNLDQFKDEFQQHLAIAELFGGYKLSIHSGSDKFMIYEILGEIKPGAIHIKTAGTSYLKALEIIAMVDPDLFREIVKFSTQRYDVDKKTYHASADIREIPDIVNVGDEKLFELLNDKNIRQILHVTYGSVLSGEFPEANNFRKRIMHRLAGNEDLYEENLTKHFQKHLLPFSQSLQ